MSRKRAVSLQALGGYLNTAIQIIQGLVLIPMYIYFLGPRLYGFWLSSGSILGMLGVMNLGLGGFMIQRVATAYGQRQLSTVGEYFFNGLIVYLVLSLGFVALGLLFSYNLPLLLKGLDADEALLTACFQLALVAAGMGFVNDCLRGFANAMLRPIYPAFALASARILGMVGTVVLLNRNAGLWAIPIGMLLSEGLVLLFGLAQATILIRGIGVRLRLSMARIREYIRYGGMLFVARLSHALSRELDPILITYFIRPEITAVYMITRKAADIVFQMIAVVYSSTHAAFSHLAGDADQSRTSDIAVKLLALVFFLGLIGFTSYVAFNSSFVALWVGGDFSMGQDIILLIGLAYFLSSLRNMVLQLLNGMGEFSVSSRLILLESVIKTAFAVFLLNVVGVQGIPLAMIIAGGAMVAVISRLIKKQARWQITSRVLARAIVTSIVLFGFAVLLSSMMQVYTWVHFALFVAIGMTAVLLIMAVSYFNVLKRQFRAARENANV